jgi:hypothetical protein
MEELLTRVWEMLIGREHGPLAFRIIIQPMVAAFLAIRTGLRDARAGRPRTGGPLRPIRFIDGNLYDRVGRTWGDSSPPRS